MRTAKRFIEFYACGTEGKAGGKPTTHSIDGFWRRFSAAWARQTRNPISYKIKKSVKNVRAILLLSLFSPIASQDADLGSLFMGHSKKTQPSNRETGEALPDVIGHKDPTRTTVAQ